MLTLEDKEFVRLWVEETPIVLGSHLRAIKAAICLRRLLQAAEVTGLKRTDPEAIREATLMMHESGREVVPAEVQAAIEAFNMAVRVTHDN